MRPKSPYYFRGRRSSFSAPTAATATTDPGPSQLTLAEPLVQVDPTLARHLTRSFKSILKKEHHEFGTFTVCAVDRADSSVIYLHEHFLVTLGLPSDLGNWEVPELTSDTVDLRRDLREDSDIGSSTYLVGKSWAGRQLLRCVTAGQIFEIHQ